MSPRIAVLLLLAAALAAGLAGWVYFSDGEAPPRFVDLGPRIAAQMPKVEKADRSGKTLARLDFATPGDRAAVRADAGTRLLDPDDSGARIRVEAAENRITIDLPEWSGGGRDASRATLLLLTIGVSKAHNVTRLYWTAPGAAPDERRSAPIAFPYDGRTHTVVVPLEDSPEWSGEVASLHLRLGTSEQDLVGEESPIVTLGGLTFLETTLLERFAIEGAGIESEGSPSLHGIRIGADTRPAALAPAPSRFECAFTVPVDGPRLDGMVALHPAAFSRHAEPVEFSVRVDGEPIFVRSVDPMKAADRGWLEYRVDLARFAGRSIRLSFETASAGGAGAYAFVGRPVVTSAPSAAGADAVRGVILFSLDTLRADRLGCYGREGPPDPSPRLDALAGESVRFARAIAPAPETIASHMSLFTACAPSVHAIVDVGSAIADDVVTLAERFAEAGFATAAFTEGGNVGAAFGFAQGFDTFVETERGARGEKRIEETIAAAERWLAAHDDRPFFLFVHTYEAHTPYDPPEPLRKLFDPDYAGPFETNVSWGTVEKMIFGTLTATERDYEHVRRLYDAGIRHVDAVIGAFVERLRASGTLDRSIVAVTSDHGEDFFDHFGFATHGHSLYDELLHVPLIVRVPGAAPGVVEEMVELLSLGPTLLDVMGLPPLPQDPAVRVQGKSFAGALRGDRFDGPEFVLAEDKTFFERLALRFGEAKFIVNPTIAVEPGPSEDASGGAQLARDIRAILSQPRFAWTGVRDRLDGWLSEVELYDLKSDPREQVNLAAGGERANAVADYRRRLEAYRISLPPPLPQRHSTLSAADIERLKALGYITGTTAPPAKPAAPKKPD